MKLILAPMQGMTTAHYRNVYSELFGGFDQYYSPFISTTEKNSHSLSLFKDIFPEANDKNLKVIPQLLGNNGEDFRNYAKTITELGYKEINWNIGCPSPTVTKKKKGSGILAHPDMIKSFLDEVCKDNSFELTIKMRLGLNNLEEGVKIIDLINDYPIKGVILHARTGSQRYTGTVDLDSFEVLRAQCKHDMTYNGDIYTLEDYINIQERFPMIDKFMLGRGALRDPFLASAIKGNITNSNNKLVKMRAFHDSVYNDYKIKLSGDKHLIDRMKEFWMYNSVHLDPSGKLMKKIRNCTSVPAYSSIVNKMLDPSNIWVE